ncbi:type 2 lactosamine alpha-2,3-sialyltransferase isoform X2 [Callorhinchus milii]|uniref:Type 2 lactosamine alpha-2,3-sialyltransferase n=1 Tax=Callorhinchus milii TaxID=7868 RepID=A0A4W3KIR5_CALMI|nr:type 2 lactosamine alpha-2,3-sialyltransferase isoform X2 [Callorhinchus milii]|eukprot:gi/632956414/ref/XP_007893946.1/ PREDICTED: type 2 lactosamine alpha-2,3-sialyltransferase isoform X2 [Callorhinchus milii]
MGQPSDTVRQWNSHLGMGNLKKRRCIKLLLPGFLLTSFCFYLMYFRTTIDHRSPKHQSPFLCLSDISHSKVPVNEKTILKILPFSSLTAERYFRATLNNLKSCELPASINKVPCLKCIVVGNGAVLQNKSLGKQIDSYDVVIRLNSGPVIGYENDVGNKTTFRLCYPESIISDPSQYDANTILVFVPFKPLDLRWLVDVIVKNKVSDRGFWKKPPASIIYRNNQIRILNPSIVKRAAFDLLKLPMDIPIEKPPQYPTTGIIAISMALTMCNEVHVAGFKYDFINMNSTLHYYSNDTMSSMGKMLYHNISAEQILLKQLKSSNTVFDLTGNF